MNKRIRIAVGNPILASNAGLTHTGTSYQVAKFPDFENPTNILFEDLNNTIDKLNIYITIDSDDYKNLFIRTRYHFTKDDGEVIDDNWSRIIPVNSKQKGFKISNIIIDTPVIDYETDGEHLTIKTTDFSMYYGPGSHMSTSWRVRDNNNEIIYERLEDKDNLTSILLHNILEFGKSYILEAKHHSNINNESNWGKFPLLNYVQNNNLFDLELIGDLTYNRKQYFKLKLYTSNFSSLDIEVRSASGAVINSIYNSKNLVNFIRMEFMSINQRYDIYARIKFTDGVTTEYKLIHSNLLNDNHTVRYNPFTKYIGNYSKSNNYFTNGIAASNTQELYDGNIIFTDFYTDTLSLYRYNGKDLVKLKELVSLDSNLKIDYVNIKQLRGGDILVNYMSTNANSYKSTVFKIYSYDPIKLELKLLHTINRPFEKYSTAINNSLVIDKSDNVYYIPALEVDVNGNDIPLSLYMLNTRTGVVTKKLTLPGNIIRNATIVLDIDDIVYIMGGSTQSILLDNNEKTWKRDNDIIYKYNKSINKIEEFRSLANIMDPDVYCIHPVLRRDGVIALFNGVHNGPAVGNNDVVLYDVFNDNITLSEIDNNYDVPFRTFIVKNSGDIVRISSLERDPQISMTYLANTLKLSEIVDVDDVTYDKNLVVKDGEIVTIESPYIYDSIKVEGTGKLIWMDRNLARTITSSTYIATRSHIMPKSEWESSQYEDLIVLDGVNFVIAVEAYDKNLVVKNGESISIENPYMYDSIKIIGTGKLLWMDKGTLRTITSSTYVATRSHTMSKVEWESSQYEDLLVLDGVNFVIVD